MRSADQRTDGNWTGSGMPYACCNGLCTEWRAQGNGDRFNYGADPQYLIYPWQDVYYHEIIDLNIYIGNMTLNRYETKGEQRWQN